MKANEEVKSTSAHDYAPVYQIIAAELGRRKNCLTANHKENLADCETHLKALEDELPSGSGWDSATKIDLDNSAEDKIILYGSFHHMDECGGYDGWTDHTITIRPSLQFGFNLTISGRDRNDIKEYLHELFQETLSRKIYRWTLPR